MSFSSTAAGRKFESPHVTIHRIFSSLLDVDGVPNPSVNLLSSLARILRFQSMVFFFFTATWSIIGHWWLTSSYLRLTLPSSSSLIAGIRKNHVLFTSCHTSFWRHVITSLSCTDRLHRCKTSGRRRTYTWRNFKVLLVKERRLYDVLQTCHLPIEDIIKTSSWSSKTRWFQQVHLDQVIHKIIS